ncbi:hypothetical protein [Nonomuraea sediminis]|uniref:hypothetical protein n=1 Tax=Nonomuraea sediminis TaxID=2835864 RepID=UPI001BDD4BD9|nr:hypothetical protein [Nonomuraea sediminis]
MIHGKAGMILEVVVADVGLAALEFDDARAWLDRARRHPMQADGDELYVSFSMSKGSLTYRRFAAVDVAGS